MELARIEASFSGLSPGKHAWSINEFGDLTKGAASTGKIFNPPDHISETVSFTMFFCVFPNHFTDENLSLILAVAYYVCAFAC